MGSPFLPSTSRLSCNPLPITGPADDRPGPPSSLPFKALQGPTGRPPSWPLLARGCPIRLQVFACAVPSARNAVPCAPSSPTPLPAAAPLLSALTCAPSPPPPPTAGPPPGAGLQLPESPALPVGAAGASTPLVQFGRHWQFSNFGAERAGRRQLRPDPLPTPEPEAWALRGLPRSDTRRRRRGGARPVSRTGN